MYSAKEIRSYVAEYLDCMLLLFYQHISRARNHFIPFHSPCLCKYFHDHPCFCKQKMPWPIGNCVSYTVPQAVNCRLLKHCIYEYFSEHLNTFSDVSLAGCMRATIKKCGLVNWNDKNSYELELQLLELK